MSGSWSLSLETDSKYFFWSGIQLNLLLLTFLYPVWIEKIGTRAEKWLNIVIRFVSEVWPPIIFRTFNHSRSVRCRLLLSVLLYSNPLSACWPILLWLITHKWLRYWKRFGVLLTNSPNFSSFGFEFNHGDFHLRKIKNSMLRIWDFYRGTSVSDS